MIIQNQENNELGHQLKNEWVSFGKQMPKEMLQSIKQTKYKITDRR